MPHILLSSFTNLQRIYRKFVEKYIIHQYLFKNTNDQENQCFSNVFAPI